MKLDKVGMKQLRVKLNAALKQLSEDNELSIKVGRGSYDLDGNWATFKLEISTLDSDGNVVSKEVEDFKKNAVLYGLSPDDLGKRFTTYAGKTYEITGMSTRSHKYPIFAKDVLTGKGFKFSERQVKGFLEDQNEKES